MKYINKYTRKIISACLVLAAIFSCTKFEDYSSKTPEENSPKVVVQVAAVGDSSVLVRATTDKDGYVALLLFDGSDTNTYSSVDLLTNNLPDKYRLSYANGNVKAGSGVQIIFGPLVQNTTYKAVAVANNSEGNTSNISVETFTTTDSYSPNVNLDDVKPEIAALASQELDFSVVLPFDEPVKLMDATKIKFGYLDHTDSSIVWHPITANEVTIEDSDNSATIKQTQTPLNGNMVYLQVDSGAFADITGNLWKGVSNSGISGGSNLGMYWRTEKAEIKIDTITPGLDSTIVDSNDFVVTVLFMRDLAGFGEYSEDVNKDNSVVFTYMKANGSLEIMPVPKANVTIDKKKVLIVQPRTPATGEKVYLKIGSGVFRDVNFNSNEKFESTAEDGGWPIG